MTKTTKYISDKELYESILKLIRQAKSYLIISSPWIYNCSHLLGELIGSNQRGVEISVVMRPIENDMGDLNYQNKLHAIEKLKEANAEIIFDRDVHEKVIINDGIEMIVSSANLTAASLMNNGESGTYIQDNLEIGRYLSRFHRKYKKEFPQMNHSDTSLGKIFWILLVISILLIVVILVTNNQKQKTIDSILSERPIGEDVTVKGVAENDAEDYRAVTSRILYQRFYITDGTGRIRVFCMKDSDSSILKGNKAEVKGKFTLFGDEYQISELNCSQIKKQR